MRTEVLKRDMVHNATPGEDEVTGWSGVYCRNAIYKAVKQTKVSNTRARNIYPYSFQEKYPVIWG